MSQLIETPGRIGTIVAALNSMGISQRVFLFLTPTSPMHGVSLIGIYQSAVAVMCLLRRWVQKAFGKSKMSL